MKFFSKSLASRLYFSFLLIGFVPFLLFLAYTLYISETKIVDKLILDQYKKTNQISKFIDSHLLSLQKELIFLSELEVMDDLLAEDLDKRVSRVLELRKIDYDLNLDFLVINPSGLVIASSNKDITSKHINFQNNSNQRGSFIIDKELYIFEPVFTSFDKQKFLAYLVLKYDLNNLNLYLSDELDEFAYLNKDDVFIGEKTFNYRSNTPEQKGSAIVASNVIVFQKMQSFLQGWSIYLIVKKHRALEFLYDYIYYILLLFPILIIFTIYSSKKLSKFIVTPIENLTQVTDDIIDSKDYSKLLYMSSDDEVGKLAHSFNVLLNTTEKTLDASEAKSAFISNMSHELKTPLNAIIGFSQYLIIYEKLTDEQLDIVSNIENSSQYLLEMIHGILDIAKIEAGKVDLNLQNHNCLALSRECFEMLEPLAKDKQLDYSFDAKGFTLQSCYIDEKIFKQILINLISNAIKYTDNGSVAIKLSNSDNRILIEIVDTGVGIDSEDMGKLFKEFSRIENELSSKQKGSGLGLSLSKKLAHILGGNIYIQSDGKDKGTKAIFVLNLKEKYEHISR